MRFKIIRTLYDSLPLTLWCPKTLKYRANCKKLNKIRVDIESSFSQEQITLIDNYISLIDAQALIEQKHAFCKGVQIGASFMKDVNAINNDDMEGE